LNELQDANVEITSMTVTSDLPSQSGLSGINSGRHLESLQDQLWRAWCVYKRIPINNPLLPGDLSSEARALLEAAIIGEEVLVLDLAIQFQDGGPADNTDLRSWKEEKLFWLCQVFLNPDGTIVEEVSKVKFRNRFRLFCREQRIDAHSLEKKYLEIANALSFFPVYDWVFKREIEVAETKNSNVSDLKHAREETDSVGEKLVNSVHSGNTNSQDPSAVSYNLKVFTFIFAMILIGGVLTAGVKHFSREDKIRDAAHTLSTMTPDQKKQHEEEQTEKRLERIRKLREGRE
jgi:hypothetical protein